MNFIFRNIRSYEQNIMQYDWVELYDSFVFISLEIISDSQKIHAIEINHWIWGNIINRKGAKIIQIPF